MRVNFFFLIDRVRWKDNLVLDCESGVGPEVPGHLNIGQLGN